MSITQGTNQLLTAQGSTAPGNLEKGWFALNQANACVCTPTDTDGGGAADPNIATGDGYVFEITNGQANVGPIGEIWTVAGQVKDNTFTVKVVGFF